MSGYAHKAEDFIQRIKAGPADTIHADIRKAFAAVEAFAGKVAAIRSDKRYSSAGHSAEIAKALGNGPLVEIAQLRRGVDFRIGNLRAEIAGFAPRPPSRNDLFGELQRREVRDYLRSLPEAERRRTVLETKDPTFRDAIVHAPAALSGLDDATKSMVVSAIVAETHGEQVAFNERAVAMLEDALAAVNEAEADLRRVAELSEAEFSQASRAAA